MPGASLFKSLRFAAGQNSNPLIIHPSRSLRFRKFSQGTVGCSGGAPRCPSADGWGHRL